MELSSDDVKRLEEAGYRQDEFAVLDSDAVRLRNVGGWCYFYSLAEKNCQVYRIRPLGCSLYPVVYLADEGAVVDELCPMGHTIPEKELRAKGRVLVDLLRRIDRERARYPKLLIQVGTGRNQRRRKNRFGK
jgi:Fe-S-cluster containining protein